MVAEGKRVLIVDDEADVHEFVKAVLEETGVAFISAEDGEEAVTRAREDAPDLIILDVQMPKRDGFWAFKQLQSDESTASIPVVMLTGVGDRTGIRFDSNDMGQFLGKEPAAFVEKPVDPEKLHEVVNKLLA